MKRLLSILCLCFMTSNAMGISLFPKCRITCSSALSEKAIPKILEAGGDPSGDDTFLDCAKSCRFATTKNMWYAFLAHAIYHTAREDLEKTAQIDATLSKLIPTLPINLSYPKFVENLSIELLKNISAYGKSVDNKNRESSFLGGELLPNVHTDEFEKIAKKQPFIRKYVNHANDRHKQAGERLLKAVVAQYQDMLSRLENYTDKRFGHNIKVDKKEVFKDFQKQTAKEKKLGKPAESKGAWYSFMPIRSCARNCSTLQQGQKAGLDFTKKVIHDGKKPEGTSAYWCQQNCPAEQYGSFFCGLYDNIAREPQDFKKNNEKALNGLNTTKNRIYVTKDDRKLVDQCLNLFNEYGAGTKANDVGVVYKYNVSVLARQAVEFDKAGIEKVKSKKSDDKNDTHHTSTEDLLEGIDEEDWDEEDWDEGEFDEDEIESLIKEHG